MQVITVLSRNPVVINFYFIKKHKQIHLSGLDGDILPISS